MRVPLVKCAMLFTLVFGTTVFFSIQVWAHAGHKHEAEDPSIALPEVVARVNGKDIPGSRVITRLKSLIKGYIVDGQRPSPAQEKAETKKLIEEEIERELVRQKAEELAVEVTKKMMDGRIRSVMGRFKSENAFHKRLTDSGMTMEQYKGELRSGMLMDTLMEKEVGSKTKVFPDEIKSYYEKNKKTFWQDEETRASVILIKIDSSKGPKAGQIAKKKIESIYKEANGGADFSELAKKYSQDSLAEKGGDLGYFTMRKMLKAFSERAFRMEPDSIAKPFLTKLGWHILKTTGKRQGGYKPFKEVEGKIKKSLKDGKTSEASKAYLQMLRQNADVKIYF